MKKILIMEQMQKLEPPQLKAYLIEKTKVMFTAYNVEDLHEIGCFIVLERSETEQFPIGIMEFVEVLMFANETYLHGVRILGDSWGEDIYLPVEVVQC